MPTQGRPHKTDLEKLKSAASRAYREWQHTLTDAFADDYNDRHVQIAKGANRMGRPPKPLANIIHETEHRYTDAIGRFREFEKSQKMQESTVTEIIAFARNESPGRKAKDRTTFLKKYIRRIERKIDLIEAEDDETSRPTGGPGRPAMGREAKIVYFRDNIRIAEKEVDQLRVSLEVHERVWLDLNDLRIEARQLRVLRKGGQQAKYLRLNEQEALERLYVVEDEIKNLEQIYQEEEREFLKLERHRCRSRQENDADNSELTKQVKLLEERITLERRRKELKDQAEKLKIDVSDIAN